MASMAGTVRITVDSEAPSAMFTTDCMRLARAARSAVSISGAAEMPATISATRPMGTSTPFKLRSSECDINSARAPTAMMPAAITAAEGRQLLGLAAGRLLRDFFSG